MPDFSNLIDSASRIAQNTRISVEVARQRERIRKAYTELGRLYYEYHGSSPEGFFVQLCAEVDAANARIQELEAQKAASEAKPEAWSPAPGGDFGSVVDSTSAASPADGMDDALKFFK